jgi:hypothetical protein
MGTSKVKNQDLPAFASVAISGDNGYQQDGLTKREYFAGKALQGLLSIYDDNERNPTVPNEDNVKYMAKLAVKAADILLLELSNGDGQ